MKINKRIVVVDDDVNNATMFQDYLTMVGYEVFVAHSGREGKKAIITNKPDLIILDLYLPDMKGSDLCEKLRLNYSTKNIPIILITAHQISHFEKMKGFRAGVDDYLVRPFELAELGARMDVIFRRSMNLKHAETIAGIEAVIKPDPPQPDPVKPNNTSVDSVDHPKSTHLFNRMVSVVNHPIQTFKEYKHHEDFLTGLIAVFATPLASSLSKICFRDGGFDTWIGLFSLGLVLHGLFWVATAGLLHMALPFQGISLSMRKALAFAGLCWVPRFIFSLLELTYGLLGVAGWLPDSKGFSAGLNLIPGLYQTSWAEALAVVNIFNVWSAFLAIAVVWAIGNENGKKWNTITIIVGTVCLLFGAFIGL